MRRLSARSSVRARKLAVIVASALTLAACSSGGSASSASSNTAAPSENTASATTGSQGSSAAPGATSSSGGGAPTGSPITIGLAVSTTGKNAEPGQDTLRGAQLWVKQVNADGGVSGHPVKLTYYDDQSDPHTSAKLVEKLISQDHVDFIIGPYSSGAESAAAVVTEKYKVPMIAPGAGSDANFQRGFKYSFQMYTPASKTTEAYFKIAKEKGYKSVAIVHSDDAFSNDAAKGAAAAAKAEGLDVVYDAKYPPTATDLSSIVQAAKAKNPDVFMAASHFQDSVLLTRQAKSAGFTPKIFAFAAAGPATAQFPSTVGPSAENIMGVSQWEPAAAYPGNKEFVEAFKAEYKADPSYTAAGAYGAGELLKAAVAKAGSTDKQKVRDALAALDMSTVFGPYKVNDQGYQTGHESVIIQIQNGTQATVYPSSAAQAQPVVPFPGWK
jgi:branched-chain amino acid transport system substrate-binding protein